MSQTADMIFEINFLSDGCMVTSNGYSRKKSTHFIISETTDSPENNRDFMHKSIMDFVCDELEDKLFERQNNHNQPTSEGELYVK